MSPDHPATLPLAPALEKGELPAVPPGPWQSESLLAESWSTMGDVDRDETKSLGDGSGSSSPHGGGAGGGEERSDNHSSIMSDLVHLDKEEAELLLEEAEKAVAEMEVEEEDDEDEDELGGSMLSVLGGDSELAELRMMEEEPDPRGAGPETGVPGRQVVPPMALPMACPLPVVRLEPPSNNPTPVPALTVQELEQMLSTQALHPPPVLAAAVEEDTGTVLAPDRQPLDQSPPPLRPTEEPVVAAATAAASQGAAVTAPAKAELEKEAGPEKKKAGPEIPMMLCGGAALVAVVGVVAYGAVVYCRK